MEQHHVSRAELLATYVKLRYEGHSMADAVAQVKPFVGQLSNDDRKQLSHDVNAWEEDQLAVTDHVEGKPQMCPHCGRKNSATAHECASCFQPLTSTAPGTVRMRRDDFEMEAHLNRKGRLYLLMGNRKVPVDLSIFKEIIIGRSLPDSAVKPHIDLAPYNGEKLGVSRAHASLKMRDETVIITDLESSNFTFINEERLYPHETRVLRHGDQIKLGEFTMKVSLNE
jgi:hypothetical protein